MGRRAANWPAAVVGHLCALKAQGVSFDHAWKLTMELYPPRGRDLGDIEPRLFEEDGRSDDGLVPFMQRACLNAWEDRVGPKGSGNGPRLKNWRVEMLIGTDDSKPARRAPRGGSARYKQAA